ncbi:tyrosine-type recombinase/integrase [Natronorubrum bangense]|uniref:Integrase family protein n=2 Tax=Natronorubrum bangense TaxID=61858 RepID=L9WPF3_9EURY|nr:tyrosine-type recombinase/integrase [Natronorubrum bangense]ELY51071.1 integrase family protein [Natronorubrum bangense JCM 10635]QCC54511.1 site-specific integrase [Natronorubrum bangense]
MTNETLEPISPAEAKEMYLNARKHEVSQSTLDGYHYRLKHFIRWCENVEELENMNDLTGRKLQQFKTWRRDDGDLKPITLEGNLDTLRVFIRWCESIDAVSEGLHDKIVMPILKKHDEQADGILNGDDADELLSYLRRFKYASRRHVIVELFWQTGMRLGALRSIDVTDYDPENRSLLLEHRPNSDTPLKNGEEGERLVALTSEVCRVLDDWIDHNRHGVTDEYGREPLLTTENGRIQGSSIRDEVYFVTRPCFYGGECPVGRDPDECEATNYGHYSKCPSNVSPHDIRRGSITHHLSNDIPEKVVSDRMNVGMDVLDIHYDKRSEQVKMEQRRAYLENV